MATAVESLGQLERRLTISVPLTEVQSEVEKRLKARARTAKAPGFRPGKVPLKMIAAQYGYQIESEVLNDRVGRAFADAANENNLRVAGYPKIEPKEGSADGTMAFDATFEVYPDVQIADLTGLEIEKITSEVSDAEIDKTIEILRKQRVHYHTKGEHSEHGDGGSNLTAQNGDRVTVDFAGQVGGVEFEGGKSENYPFVLGEGRMLPEFEAGVLGLSVGESKTFPLTFPEDYPSKDVAGKTAEFTLTLKKLEWAHLPEVDADFAKSLGVASGELQQMRDDVKQNLGREISARVKAKNKDAVMAALVAATQTDVPKYLLNQEIERMSDAARADMQQRGMDVKEMKLPPELFATEADRRVRLGLILSRLVSDKDLYAKPEQVKAQVEEFAQSYEDPLEVLKYYFSDRTRLAEVEALVIEENVVNYVLDQAKVTEKLVSFDELMGNQGQA